MQESFIFYDSFREVGKDMEEKSRLAFYEAIIDYALTGELNETNLPKEIKLLFKLVKPQIDANTKRKKDSKKGGRPTTKRQKVQNPHETTTEYTEEQFGRTLAPAEIELIKSWDYSEEIIKLAVDETVLNQVNSIKYTDKILYEWDKQGLNTVNDIKNKLKQRREKEEDVDTSDVSYYRSLE